MIPHKQIMDNVGFANISNNFHEFGKTSGAWAIVSGIMEIVGNVGKTNNFYDSPQKNHGKCWFCQHFQHVPWIWRDFGSKKTVNTKLGSLRSHSKRNLAFPEMHNYQGTQTNIREKASDLNRTQPGYRGGVPLIYIPAEPGVENFLDHRNVSRKSSGSWNLVNFQEFGWLPIIQGKTH